VICCADRSAVFERDCGEDGVHDERTGVLSVAHKAAQDVPVPFARVESPAAGWASQEEIAASASVVKSGRSNARGFVVILRKARSVSQATRTRSGPESAASSQARLSFQPAAQRLVDDLAKRPAGASRFRRELGRHIVIQGQCRFSCADATLRHHEVKKYAPIPIAHALTMSCTRLMRSESLYSISLNQSRIASLSRMASSSGRKLQ
jgi:hypothetical protein